MGCCQSVPDAPDTIIPDPLPGQNWHFVVESLSMFNSDVAYQDKKDEDTKWLFLNQTGSMWDDDATIDLENFVRGKDPKDPKKGEILWRCRYDSKPEYEDGYNSDSSDDDILGTLFDFLGGDSRNTAGMKFKMKTEAIFEPVKYGGPPFKLKCKAKGWTRRTVSRMDGTKDYSDETEVRKVSYKIKDMAGNTLDKFKIHVDHHESTKDVEWESNAFNVKKRGGWKNRGLTDVYTKGGGDPGLALVMGHFVSTELTPAQIESKYTPDYYTGIDGYNSDYYSD